jgi:release factor glutamine methyltransferase
VQEDTALLREAVRDGDRAAGRSVLDVGAGTGAVAIEAARAGAASVTAIDLSRRSVLASWINSRFRGVPARVRRGDLFGPVRAHRFDLVLANPPYVPASTRRPRGIARCWDAGPDGRQLLDRLCASAPSALTRDGSLLLVQSEIAGEQATVDRLGEVGLVPRVVARSRVPFGPVLRTRAPELRRRGLLDHDQEDEGLVVIEAGHG